MIKTASQPTPAWNKISKPSTAGLVGFDNLGNSCYMNCILQCLMHAEPLLNYFLEQGQAQDGSENNDNNNNDNNNDNQSDKWVEKTSYLAEVNKTNPLGSGGLVAAAFCSLLKTVWSGDESTTFSPIEFKATFTAFARHFNNNHQHDAQEFASSLLDVLHEDLNRVPSSSASSAADKLKSMSLTSNGSASKPQNKSITGMDDQQTALNTWKAHLERNDSVVVDRFQGLSRSTIRCPRCQKRVSKFDVYTSIHLDLDVNTILDAGTNTNSWATRLAPGDQHQPKPISIESCLKKFTRDEELDDSNPWTCPKCKEQVKAIKTVQLWSTPDVLILHLKRYTTSIQRDLNGNVNISRMKMDDAIEFPFGNDEQSYLDMNEFIAKDGVASEQSNRYALFGVVDHSGGMDINQGHYTSTVKHLKEKTWRDYNDTFVTGTPAPASGRDSSSTAYLLFYKRVQGSLKWGGMDTVMSLGVKGYKDMKKSSVKPVDDDGFTTVVRKAKKKR